MITVNPLNHERRRRNARRGFTIIELLIVIGILHAIGGIVLVNVIGAQDRADVGVTKVQMQGIEDGLQRFRVDMKRWPSEEEGVAVLWSSSGLEDEEESSKWGGPYLQKPAPNDQWGSAWVYRNPSEIEGLSYDLISIGPDREEGTDDDLNIHESIAGEDGSLDDEFSDFASTPSENG